MQIRDIFIEALQKPSREPRSAYLAEACGDDAVLRKQVEELLAVHERQESFFLDAPAAGLADAIAPVAHSSQRIGSHIGRIGFWPFWMPRCLRSSASSMAGWASG